MTFDIRIAIDAMGGKDSPDKVIKGISLFAKDRDDVFFEIHGNKNILEKKISSYSNIKDRTELIHCDKIILDTESPLQAAKQRNDSSMNSAINSVKLKRTQIALSAGNTGALLILSRLKLDMIENIDKPALAGLWPNQNNTNIVLDLGANIECTEKNLLDFSVMGAALHKSLFPFSHSKVSLLNIGTEEIKGSEILKKTNEILKRNSNQDNFSYVGFIEGNDIMKGNSNVIVTDGFTGNIALKTAEGTANFISTELKKTFKKSLLSRVGSLLLYSSLKSFKNKLDPRKYNGAILLGLKAPIVKSHGSTDEIGFKYSLEMCRTIIKNNLINKIKSNINEFSTNDN